VFLQARETEAFTKEGSQPADVKSILRNAGLCSMFNGRGLLGNGRLPFYFPQGIYLIVSTSRKNKMLTLPSASNKHHPHVGHVNTLETSERLMQHH
jgi:hypothetical protein